MPCCCASNVKAAYVIGIILAVLYALGIIFSFKKLNNGITFESTFDIIISTFDIIIGFLGLVSASILAYGAHTRNSKAMIIYMVSAVLIIILFIFVTMVNTFIGDDNLSKIVEEACKGQENDLRIYGPSLKNKSIKKSNGNFTYYII